MLSSRDSGWLPGVLFCRYLDVEFCKVEFERTEGFADLPAFLLPEQLGTGVRLMMEFAKHL